MHAVAVTVEWQGDELVMGIGGRSSANAQAHPDVSLLWPPFEPGGYSLISDGVARDLGDERMAFSPTKAVLHRPAPGQSASGSRAIAAPTACRSASPDRSHLITQG